MSSILKALKKLEEEKSRQQQGKVDIATDILRSAGKQQKSNWSIGLTLTILVFGGIFGGIYVAQLYMPQGLRGEAQTQPAQTQPAQTQPAQTQPAQTQPAQTPPAQTQPAQAQPAQTQPAQTQPAQTRPAQARPAQAQPAQAQPVQVQPAQVQPAQAQPAQAQPAQAQPVQVQPAQVQPAQAQPVQVQPVQVQPVQVQPVQVQPAVAQDKDPAVADTVPRLVVSGIAYQENVENRMAVVNDLPVLAGTSIAGAEVVEILPDRVVFSYQGRSFSVPLSGSP